MDTAVLEIPEAKARAEVAAYRRMVRERHVAEDALILRGYKAIAAGKKILSLTETIRRGGFDEVTGLPKLGISRADAKTVRCAFRWAGGDGSPLTYWWESDRWGAPRMANGTLLNDNALRLREITKARQSDTRQAIVPIVPPALRPAALSAYHILFEADWQPVPRPPGEDPALLKHIGGDLWALIATWDLTDLERLVLIGRH
jgi:hypothetical protein